MDVLSKGGRDGKAEFFEATDDRAKDGDLIFIKPLVVKVNNESAVKSRDSSSSVISVSQEVFCRSEPRMICCESDLIVDTMNGRERSEEYGPLICRTIVSRPARRRRSWMDIGECRMNVECRVYKRKVNRYSPRGTSRVYMPSRES